MAVSLGLRPQPRRTAPEPVPSVDALVDGFSLDRIPPDPWGFAIDHSA